MGPVPTRPERDEHNSMSLDGKDENIAVEKNTKSDERKTLETFSAMTTSEPFSNQKIISNSFALKSD